MKALRLGLTLLALIITTFARGQSSLLHTPYTPPKWRGPVQFYLDDITQRAHVQISYSDEAVRRQRPVRLNGGEKTVEDVLTTLLAGTGITIAERGGKILLIPPGETILPKQSVTISGFVKDSASREVLIGAMVYIPALNAVASTNTYGFYSLTIPPGKHEIITGAFGYRSDTADINAAANLRRDVLLPFGLALAGVTVSSQKETSADHVHLSTKELSAHAGLLGENDVTRALQYLPGVQTGTDGSSTMLVRGGDPGQNLNLLDGVPLYYIDHIFGITSVFNTGAVKSVDFYKGAFPARYGGRLSSIIDVSSRDGNMERISGEASLGLLKGNLSLEGPIIKDKASIMVSARRTWVDVLWRPFFDGFGLDFYDVNAKANYIINKSNRVYVSFYTGRDQFRIRFDATDSRARWGNTIGAARWTSVITPKLFISTTATYSNFRYQLRAADPDSQPDSNGTRSQYTGNSTISDLALRVQADYFLSAKQHFQLGGQLSSADFSPASADFDGSTYQPAAANFRSTEIIGYAEDEWKPSQHWTIRGGLHLATWISERYQYTSLQPRLYASWQPDGRQTFYGSLTKMSQFLHLLSGNTSVFPADFWIPSTSRIAPERSWLYAIGYSRKMGSRIRFNAEAYYKGMHNVVSYKGSNNIFENSQHWEAGLTQGRGYNYGTEVSANGKAGPFTASVAYTLSWAWRQFDIMNEGKPFPYRYDRRHNFHTELSYQKRARFNAVASWTYMSGEAITLPDQLYPDFGNNLPGGISSSNPFTYNYSARNDYRLPAIHRLDVAVNFMRHRGHHFERTWTLGIFNAYGRKNIMAVNLVQDDVGQFSLEGISLLRFIPTISYAVKF